MKTQIVLLVFLLVGCGNGSGGPGSPSGITPPPNSGNPGAPTCKAFKSVWTSNTSSEVHDLRNVGTSYAVYAYTGYNGVHCPTTSQRARINVSGSVAISAGFEYTMEFDITTAPPAVGCDYWKDSVNHGSALMHHDCNKLTLCQGLTFGCKDFY